MPMLLIDVAKVSEAYLCQPRQNPLGIK